ncbi:MAG: class I SAM-dependent methyltransferase [Myxococcota bacterium]
MRVALLLVVLLLPAVPVLPARAQEPHSPEHGRGDRATVTHGFEDVERWVSVFDDPERDAWQKPGEVVAALGLRPGDVVADVGAGTGYFNPHWSRAVGSEGAVLAVDMEPSLVVHLRDRAEREGTRNVVPILGSANDPRLPPGVVDAAVLVNTYHHIDLRRDYFRRFKRFLAPGGRLVIVDWSTEVEVPVGPPLDHRLSAERVAEELGAAGFVPVGRVDFLPYQYIRIFRVADERAD